jgi:nitrogen fixation protein FixH
MKRTKRKSRWGVGVAVLYGSFAAFILTLVGYMALQEYHLVDPDYYRKGIQYQSQIDRIERTRALGVKPEAALDRDCQMIVVNFPNALRAANPQGRITLYRPSDAEFDISVPIALDSAGNQRIPYAALTRGNWKVKIDWSANDATYFTETSLYLTE